MYRESYRSLWRGADPAPIDFGSFFGHVLLKERTKALAVTCDILLYSCIDE